MKKAVGGRQTGKTTKLINLSAETKSPIIARNAEVCRMINKQAEEMGVSIGPVFPITDITRNLSVRGFIPQRNSVIVDDADIILQAIFDALHIGKIEAISLSTNDMNDELI